MEFTLYIGSKKVKHAIGYILSKNAWQDFQEPKENIIWTKHQVNQEAHKSVIQWKDVQIISKKQITKDLFNKVQQVN